MCLVTLSMTVHKTSNCFVHIWLTCIAVNARMMATDLKLNSILLIINVLRAVFIIFQSISIYSS